MLIETQILYSLLADFLFVDITYKPVVSNYSLRFTAKNNTPGVFVIVNIKLTEIHKLYCMYLDCFKNGT